VQEDDASSDAVKAAAAKLSDDAKNKLCEDLKKLSDDPAL